MRKDSSIEDIIFIFYLLTVLILAVIYFSVPEREAFIKRQIEWWNEFGDVITSFLKGG